MVMINKHIESIWATLNSKLYSFILGKVNDKSVAEDILHDLYIKIHANIDTLNDDTKIQSWIYQIARNLIIDYYRSNSRQTMVPTQSLVESVDEYPDNNSMEEALEDMIKMMNNLPSGYCEALCLTEIEGMSQKAYAEKIGISYSGAKSRVQRAREMLKDMLMKCCHYEFDRYGTVIGIYPAHCCCCHK
jgi:RNA polymerase sigma-70 factor, ECF subfamily